MEGSRKSMVAVMLDLVVGGLISILALTLLVSGIMAGIETPGNLFPPLIILFLPPGALAVVSGIHALRRKILVVALVCSIAAAPFGCLTIPAIILTAQSKKNFA